MHVRGKLEDRSPADILEWIEDETKTGVLRFYDPKRNIRKDIWFESGQVISSGSNNPREWLGQFLIAKGKITEQDFLRAYRTQVETKVLFGKVLAMIGLASEADVQDALQEKTTEAILDVFLWLDGYFEFEDAEHPLPEQRLPLSIDVTKLIEEGETRQIEWGVIRQLFPASQAYPQVNMQKLQETSPVLDPREKRMLTLAVGQKTFVEIALDMHMPEFLVLKRFHEFHNKGLVTGAEVVDFEPIEIEIEVEPLEEGAPMPQIHTASPRQPKPTPTQTLSEMRAKIPVLLKQPEELMAMQFSAEEGYILSRIDGTYDLNSVFMVCPFQEAVALQVVQKLIDAQIVDLRDPV